MKIEQKYIDRFKTKFKKMPSGCWIWQNGLTISGYGQYPIRVKNIPTTFRAHRFSYLIYKGNIKNLCVLHKCDNPACVNHKHLFLGTHADNIKDKCNKKRQAMGKKTNITKYTKKQVLKIRKEYTGEYGNMWFLAEKYNIPYASIWSFIRRRNWKHI